MLSLVVLSRDKKASSTNTILKMLAIWDLAFLLLTIIKNCLRNYVFYFVDDAYYVSRAGLLSDINIYGIFPLYTSSLFGSYMMTLLVTIDRYIAVCKPLMIRNSLRIKLVIASASLAAIVFHIPTVFEYETILMAGVYRETYMYEDYHMVYRVKESSLYNNLWYLIIYKVVLETLVRDLLTMILLAVFNLKLYRKLKDVKARYLKMRRGSNMAETRRHVTSSESLTRTIVIIVASFIILNMPTLAAKLIYTTRLILLRATEIDYMSFVVSNDNSYKQYFHAVANLLTLISVSINFIFYIIFAKKFKRIFIKLFCSCRWIKRRFDDLVSTSIERQSSKVQSTQRSVEKNNNAKQLNHSANSFDQNSTENKTEEEDVEAVCESKT